MAPDEQKSRQTIAPEKNRVAYSVVSYVKQTDEVLHGPDSWQAICKVHVSKVVGLRAMRAPLCMKR